MASEIYNKAGKRIEEEKRLKPVKLDVRDKKILYYLSQNARLPLSTIAKYVGISRMSVKRRIERLKEMGVFQGGFVLIDMTVLGFCSCTAFLKFQNLNSEKEKRFLDFLTEHPEVMWIVKCSGYWNMVLNVAAKNMFELDNLLLKIRGRVKEHVTDFDYMPWICEYKFAQATPVILEGLDIEPLNVRRSDPSFQKEFRTHRIELDYSKFGTERIDEKDTRILEILSDDVRIGSSEIGKRVGISKENVRYRIKNMIARKVIDAFWPILSFSRLGLQWYCLLIRFDTCSPEMEKELERYVKSKNNIYWALRGIGRWNLLVHLHVRNSREYSEILDELTTKFPELIGSIESLLMLEEFKVNYSSKIYAESADKSGSE